MVRSDVYDVLTFSGLGPMLWAAKAIPRAMNLYDGYVRESLMESFDEDA
jgi:hypothetical protein